MDRQRLIIRLMSYAPSLVLLVVGLLVAGLFSEQPSLTVNLSNFGLGSGTANAGGENISVGWLAVLASLVMYIFTWWKERKAGPLPAFPIREEGVKSRGLFEQEGEKRFAFLDAANNRLSRAFKASIIAFSILAIILTIGLIL